MTYVTRHIAEDGKVEPTVLGVWDSKQAALDSLGTSVAEYLHYPWFLIESDDGQCAWRVYTVVDIWQFFIEW